MARQFRFVKVDDVDEAYKFLHSIADQASPDLVKAFLKAVEAARRGIPVSKIERDLRTYDIEKAIKDLNWEEVANTELTPDVRSTLRDVFEAVGTKNLLPVRALMDFDIVNPRAIDFIRNEVGNLITNVNLETVNAVRDTVQRGFEQGRGPRVMAEEIQEYIGLNSRQAGAFMKYKTSLEAKGISSGRLEQLTTNYYKRLLKERGLLIARTETINAAAGGYREQLIQAKEQDLLDSSKWEVEWLVTPDDRLCPLCKQMRGKRRPIDGVYTEGPGAGKKCPTLHPRCRCAERTIRRKSNIVFKPFSPITKAA